MEDARRYEARGPPRRDSDHKQQQARQHHDEYRDPSVKEEDDSDDSDEGEEDEQEDDEEDKDRSAFDLFPAQVIAHEDKRVNGPQRNRRTHFGIIMGPSDSAGTDPMNDKEVKPPRLPAPPPGKSLTAIPLGKRCDSSDINSRGASVSERDPVDAGLVTMDEAEELFEKCACLPLSLYVLGTHTLYQIFQVPQPFYLSVRPSATHC